MQIVHCDHHTEYFLTGEEYGEAKKVVKRPSRVAMFARAADGENMLLFDMSEPLVQNPKFRKIVRTHEITHMNGGDEMEAARQEVWALFTDSDLSSSERKEYDRLRRALLDTD